MFSGLPAPRRYHRKAEENMNYRLMQESDIALLVPLYVDYYNVHEDGEWTVQTVTKRIHQVWSQEDSYCLILEDGGSILGFVMGYFEQYDDCMAYDLVEIVMAAGHQKQGLGTAFMQELETRVKAQGAMLIQLEAVNDSFHEHFYGKLGYKTASNLVLKTKLL